MCCRRRIEASVHMTPTGLVTEQEIQDSRNTGADLVDARDTKLIWINNFAMVFILGVVINYCRILNIV